VAAFFAAEDDRNDGAVIAILKKDCALDSSTSSDAFDPIRFKSSTDLYTIWTPPPIDSRMIAQRGAFLLANGACRTNVQGPLVLSDLKVKGGAHYAMSRIADEYFRSETRGRRVEYPPNVAMFYLPTVAKPEMRQLLGSLG
jgi:hypothetical protein